MCIVQSVEIWYLTQKFTTKMTTEQENTEIVSKTNETIIFSRIVNNEV